MGINNAARGPRSLHVLTLTPFYPSAGDDATGCFVAEPMQQFAKLGIRNTVIAAQPFYRRKRVTCGSGFPGRWVRYFSFPGGIGLPTAGAFLFARVVGRVRELQRTEHIDLIHAHGALPCGHTSMLLNRELNIPYVVSVHGLDVFSDEQVRGRAGAWCRRMSQQTYAGSRRVICISERVREAVLSAMGKNCRTSVVYNGVDAERFSPGRESSNDLTILSVGNLIPIKGHEHLIRSVASLAEEFPSIQLEIIGEGPLRSRLQALAAELQIPSRVHFRGRQCRAQVADAMRRCTIFALPSRFEGLGCVYLEAMSCGKPVIGCRGQGIAEVIQHGRDGFLVGPDNEKELTLALRMLLGEPDRRTSLGVAARDTILDRFTLEQQAQHLSRIYRESAR